MQVKEIQKFVTGAHLDLVVRALDADGDGSIQVDEFVTWVHAGLGRTKAQRESFAARSSANAGLEKLLQSIEVGLASA